MTQDLGAYGSLSLVAQAVNYDSSSLGDVTPYLISLSDGTNEYINLALAGSGGDCAQGGIYQSCTATQLQNGTCNLTQNTNCVVNWPSAFTNFSHWEEHQTVTNFGDPSVNIFPTCDWSIGSAPPSLFPECAFNTTFFQGSPARLKYGVSYTAKYVLLSDAANNDGSSVSGPADLQVTVMKKQDQSSGGALDINVVLVGNDNVNASRTAQGAQNLNQVFQQVYNNLSQSNVGVKLGDINVVEWPCGAGGDAYANIASTDIGKMFQAAAPVIPSSTETHAINVFFLESFTDNASILGIAGAIGGPMINGTTLSGVTVASLGSLGGYNTQCTALNCGGLTAADLADLGNTVSHELGHYLGLNHPVEGSVEGDSSITMSDPSINDVVYDTPICTTTDSTVTYGGSPAITQSSCSTDTNNYPVTGKTCAQVCPGYNPDKDIFCSAETECAFNYIMWWTSKYFDPNTGAGDGNLFSPEQGAIMNYNPFIQ